ncbi:type II toxin-antitoxin system RelB/DinJ family antitoxin [Streptococcus anginosus]|uniref:type II toxin-antitoxin system RelB/ParD family antitoxin n=1 Tax=Streptococcus anginosus TaxID=1328 RepID=UPI00124738E2|nr:type II toxin-antitoxin system RelB/DinJ family antitoxin [Streptococcus anginosus]KAA9260555.1 RelB antitoxin [Streptococcus anginosus]MCW0934375.1 type II toxin-antitoxin system RelB/DinJ family antitoxin [Streptococcus anginosus]MCW0971524.1 type II toxin-antitoxin system RelB/DinJ family antitoxin [Streptococcus anginosus]MCW0990097.1 type II toxin-antitoxin system RelB/DinJ family antitoxin [Streptococcus anginosus]MCW0994946.1 type II toxin-antitoxin system RelB/DinJ family antitoxin 
MAITLSKQYNFKLNEATMEQARNIIKEKGMTMTDAISLFVEQIVLEQDLPIKTAEDLHREQLIDELQAQSERALREYEVGEGTSLDNMRARYGL